MVDDLDVLSVGSKVLYGIFVTNMGDINIAAVGNKTKS
jgi:uncharacterized repeat protein (TIGR01451 family)